MSKNILFFLCFILFTTACQNSTKTTAQNVPESLQDTQQYPEFNADSAYFYIEQQVAFGPRVPNTEAHIACGNYLVQKLQQFGAKVTEQKADLKAYDGTILKARNIIGSYNPDNKERILLFAHWDTRKFADEDPDPANYHTPIDGANDGGSGVGILLEIARIIQKNKVDIGIDIIFFDAEDYGSPAFENQEYDDDWALGSQYWAKNPHIPGYKAKYGILLDLVGGINASFPKEQISLKFAPKIVEKVWSKADEAGFGEYFKKTRGGVLTDDHLYVNLYAKIPSIDIIDYNPLRKNGFPDTWHTVNDNMRNISKETLRIVGETVTAVVYSEK